MSDSTKLYGLLWAMMSSVLYAQALRGFVAESQMLLDDNAWRNASMTHRSLQEAPKYFQPLSCNKVKCSQGSTTWSKLNPVDGIIPCGMCVTLDYEDSDILELPNGLDIRGTLIFPNFYHVSIKTPFVLVQGELRMLATGRVGDEPWIKILFTGNNELKFIPQDENRFVCSPSGASNPIPCNVGFKAFVVAGGKVHIRGIWGDSATWTKLHDVIRGGIPVVLPTSLPKLPTFTDACPSWSMMYENFETSDNSYGWTGGFGAPYVVTDSSTFKVTDRKVFDQGPTWDMLWVRDCLLPGQTYIFSARVKLSTENDLVGTKTSCAISNSNCLELFSTVKTPTSQIGRRKGWWQKEHDIRFGEWTNFYATFDYVPEELDAENIYQILQLRGPEEGVDIEIDDVRFSLPDPITLPDPSNACGNNLIINGNAGASEIHPYPMTSIGGSLLTIKMENGNPYFHLSGRTSNHNSMVYEFPVEDCLVPNGEYQVSASIRVESDRPILSRIELFTTFTDGRSVQQDVVDCPGSDNSGWTRCSARITLPPKVLGSNVATTRLQFETFDAALLDMSIDNVEMKMVGGSVTEIVVPKNGIAEAWGKGADILITSHTLNYEDSQVRTLVADPTTHGEGYVKLELNSAIIPPTTAQESPTFAVEVALLSRNILFEGDTDHPDKLMGAHFMVMQTPNVQHMLDGAEFRNFGQQGILGRYPIHFHLSEDVTGAVVKRNSIRGSLQRCIVVHGTNGAVLLDNIAYDTQGHCFMLEDGAEVNNIFRRNLGALTRAAIRPVSQLETDHLLPSTFWCSNPHNSWIENVAAGSKDNGFWFELRDSVRGPSANLPTSEGMNPREMSLKVFRENTSHSNGKHGIRTYPFGYLPSKEARFLNNFSYRNVEDGYFIHNSKNILIQGGIMADNGINADIDLSDNIRIISASIIGVSESFKATLESQGELRSHDDSLVGIQLHGFSRLNEGGAHINSVSFSGFADGASEYVALFDIDDNVRTNHFDFFSSLRDIVIEPSAIPIQFNFSKASARGVEDIYLVDLDSSMKPRSSSATGISSIVSNSALMKTFIDDINCDSFPSSSYMYCANTCLRTITYSVDPAMTEDFKLRISDATGRFIDLNSTYYNDGPDPLRKDWLREYRQFSASIPPGTYDSFFFTEKGEKSWPTHSVISVIDGFCEESFDVRDVHLSIPDASYLECAELIRNGDIEDSSSHPSYWLQNDGGMQVVENKGRNGSNGIADVSQRSIYGSLGQYVDTRCLERGRQYEVQVDVKLTQNEIPILCDTVGNCPKARLRVRTPNNVYGTRFSDLNIDVATSLIRPYDESGWNTLHGVFSVNANIEAGESVAFFVERQRTGERMTLDNVSVRLIPHVCDDLVFNGKFDGGTSRFWVANVESNSLQLDVKNIQGNWALEMKGRSSHWHSPEQQVRVGCMAAGSQYAATARVRLSNADGSTAMCDPSYTTGDKACPRMKLRSFVDWGLATEIVQTHYGGSIAVADHGNTLDGWYTMSGVFTANDADEKADKIELFWDQVSAKKIFIVDDISIVPATQNCIDLILNGDAEYGDTPRFWRTWVNGGEGKISLETDGGSGNVLKVSNRGDAGDGIYQFVDSRCVRAAEVWRFSARMKLISNGEGVSCEPEETSVNGRCPPIRVMGWNGDVKVVDDLFFMTNRATWSANDFNFYVNEFVVSTALAECDRIAVSVRTYNTLWDLYIDDISLKKVD